MTYLFVNILCQPKQNGNINIMNLKNNATYVTENELEDFMWKRKTRKENNNV